MENKINNNKKNKNIMADTINSMEVNVAQLLRDALKNGKVNFVFKKVDGSRRAAVGTTNTDLIPLDLLGSQKTPEQSLEEQRSQGIVRYFDIEKEGWRSCKVENILEIDGKQII